MGLGSDPSDAERQVLGSLKDWANETGVVIASLKPEYVESKKDAARNRGERRRRPGPMKR